MAPPGFDQDLGLDERVEDLTVEQLIAQRLGGGRSMRLDLGRFQTIRF